MDLQNRIAEPYKIGSTVLAMRFSELFILTKTTHWGRFNKKPHVGPCANLIKSMLYLRSSTYAADTQFFPVFIRNHVKNSTKITALKLLSSHVENTLNSNTKNYLSKGTSDTISP